DPFAAPAPSWSVPATPRREGGSKAIYVIAGFVGVGILGLLGFLVMNTMKQQGGPAAPAAGPAMAQAQPAQGQPQQAAPQARENNDRPRAEPREEPRE